MKLAPIVLFVYNRLDHTIRTVEALKKNIYASESKLIIFSDGPKDDRSKDLVISVRKYLGDIHGFGEVEIIERQLNFGLAKSIIEGVTEVVNKYEKIIVLEDDMVTSPFFLKYMNEALDFYEKEEKVVSIHGYIYPIKDSLPKTFFIKGADCWGWATWKRGWDVFEADGQKLLVELKKKKLTNEFDFFGTYPYTQMLKRQILGLNDSWAIRWYASAFLSSKLTLYPGRSLVKNIGMDDSGVHAKTTSMFDVELARDAVDIGNQEIKESEKTKIMFARYFKSLKYNGIWSKIVFSIKSFFLCLIK